MIETKSEAIVLTMPMEEAEDLESVLDSALDDTHDGNGVWVRKLTHLADRVETALSGIKLERKRKELEEQMEKLRSVGRV